MPSLNTVHIAGNVTRAPEMRYTPKGAAIANFGVGINRAWKDEQGQKHEEVTFVDVTFFGKQAETVTQYFKKGSPIIVTGRLRLESWEDKQTKEKRQKLVVVGERFSFCGDSGGGKTATAPEKVAKGKRARNAVPSASEPLRSDPVEGDDVSF